MKERARGLSSAALKIIAVITMLIDHFGYALYPNFFPFNETIYHILRGIGRISFPIYCFLLVEGFLHTKNVKKYMLRLWAFGCISEIPFDLAFHDVLFYLDKQNIFFTLLLGLLAIQGVSRCMGFQTLNYVKQIGIILVMTGLGEALHVDYGAEGVFLIVILYYGKYYGKYWLEILGIFSVVFVLREVMAAFAFLPIYFYNGKRGLKLKYSFYVIYPLHLCLIYGVNYFFGGR